MSPAPAAARTSAHFDVHLGGVIKRFGHIVAVDRTSPSLQGNVFGLVGPNSSGKSTAIRVCLGLIRPAAGTARAFGGGGWDVRTDQMTARKSRHAR